MTFSSFLLVGFAASVVCYGYNSCGPNNACSDGTYCCQAYSSSTPRCHNEKPFNFYKCKYIFKFSTRTTTSRPLTSLVSSSSCAVYRCGLKFCSNGMYCCQSKIGYTSGCYVTVGRPEYVRFPEGHTCTYVGGTPPRRTAPPPARKCGLASCMNGQYCCKQHSHDSGLCYNSRQTDHYSCLEILIYNSTNVGRTFYRDKISVAAIVGTAVGGLVLIAIVVLACVCFCCKRRKARRMRGLGAHHQKENIFDAISEQPGADIQQVPQQGYGQQQNIVMTGTAPPQ